MAEAALGWQVGAFINERVERSVEGETSATDLWLSYLDWCEKADLIPITMARFQGRIEEIMGDAKIARLQKGGHVSYAGVSFVGNHRFNTAARFVADLERDGHEIPRIPHLAEVLLASERYHGRTEEDYSKPKAERELNHHLTAMGEKAFPEPKGGEYDGLTLARSYAEPFFKEQAEARKALADHEAGLPKLVDKPDGSFEIITPRKKRERDHER